jgi:hypothetical protein
VAGAARPLIAALALAAGAAAAWVVVSLLPAGGDDVERARALGIVSVSILAGHSKSAESLAYFAGMAAALATSLAVWRAFARGGEAPESRPVPVPVSRLELALAALLLFAIFSRLWRLPEINPWALLAEEGEMLAWVDAVLRGAALSRDVFCLYGPLSTWPVALLFHVFGPSIALWRGWIFATSAAGLVATYLLLRGLLRTRAGALAAVLAIGVFSAGSIPGMSWSLSRVGLGLAALACLGRSYGAEPRRWLAATGALLGAALLYSQEVGIAGSLAVAAALALRRDRWSAFAWTALGGAALLAPAVAYIAAQGALGATIDNLFLFPRVRMLGFGALPFPAFEWEAYSLRAYLIPAFLTAAGFATGTRLLAGERGARVSTELALFVFGLLLFSSALSRPDSTHFAFAAPPALVLIAGLVEDAVCLATTRTAPAARRVCAAAAVALAALSIAPYGGWLGNNLFYLVRTGPEGRPLELERGGRIQLPERFAGDLERVVAAIRERTAPDEPIWAFPNEPLVYFLADRPQATSYPMALFAVTRAQRQDLIAQLERVRPRFAVMNMDSPAVDGIAHNVAYPELIDYVYAHYKLEADFGSFSLVRRKS